jgi:hypothetical protein
MNPSVPPSLSSLCPSPLFARLLLAVPATNTLRPPHLTRATGLSCFCGGLLTLARVHFLLPVPRPGQLLPTEISTLAYGARRRDPRLGLALWLGVLEFEPALLLLVLLPRALRRRTSVARGFVGARAPLEGGK